MAHAFHDSTHVAPTDRRGNRVHALALAILTALFGLRVLGQAVQRWVPQPFLPPEDAFQGSGLPFALLLASQLMLMGLMIGITSRVSWGVLRRSARAGRILGWIGGAYMAGSLTRIAVGVVIPDAPHWFTAWIPAVFHVVLAAFVLTLASYHAEERGGGEWRTAR